MVLACTVSILQSSRDALHCLLVRVCRRVCVCVEGVSSVSRLSVSASSALSPGSSGLLPQSMLSGDGARPVPLMEHLRRVRCGNTTTTTTTTRTADHSQTLAVGNVGLKDLLLSNDEDDVLVNSHGSGAESDSGGVAAASRDEETVAIVTGNSSTRPDSSTTKQQTAKQPAVLLMSLLSRHDDDDDDNNVDDVRHVAVAAASDRALTDGDAHLAEQPARNHLLRVRVYVCTCMYALISSQLCAARL